MGSFAIVLRRLRRAVLARRRLLAAVFAGLAVAAALRSVTAPPPPTVHVVTAARDLPAGTVLTAADVRKAAFAPGSAPAGAMTVPDLVGRTTAAPLRAGEPVTDVRVVRPSLLHGYPGLVAAPVRLGDTGAARLLRVGDRIDLVAAQASGDPARVVAPDAAVVAIPDDEADGFAADVDTPGALVVVAVPRDVALDLAASAVSAVLSPVFKSESG